MPKFPRAAGAEFHHRRGLKYQRFVLSQSWRLEDERQRAVRTLSSVKALEKDPSLPLASVWGLALTSLCMHYANVCFGLHSVTSLCVFGH